jgi:hypothetical protein
MSILEHFSNRPSSFTPSTPVDLLALMLAMRLHDISSAPSYSALMARHSVHSVVHAIRTLLRQGQRPRPDFYRLVVDALRREDHA